MKSFARWVVRWRVAVVAAVVVLTVLAAWAIVRWWRVEPDISKFLPPDDPVVKSFTEAGERFGSVAVAMVGLESDQIFTRAGLLAIDQLTRRFQQIPGVTWVVSLTNSDDVEKIEEGGERGVAVRKIFRRDEFTGTEEQLRELKQRVLSKERLVGTVISADAGLAQFLVHISDDADRVEVAEKIEQVAGQSLPEWLPEGRLYYTGFPFWMKTLTDMILRDMMVLVPFVTLIIILALWLSFRTLRGVVLPLLTVLISSVWAMGLMFALGIPITTLSNAVPVLLIALGTAYAIHLLHKFDEAVGTGMSVIEAIQQVLPEVMTPIGMAGLTTIIGFLSFYTARLIFIRQTGLIAACGIFFAMLISLTFLPAVLSWLPACPGRSANRRTYRWLDGFAAIVHQRSGLVVLVGSVLAAGCVVVMPRLERRFNMIDYFPPDSNIVRADNLMRARMGGSVPAWITVSGPIKHPYVLKSMLWIEKYLRSLSGAQHPSSVAGFLAEVGDALGDRWGIPDSDQGVGNLWLQLEGKDVLEQLVDREQKNALVQAVCASADTDLLREVTIKVEQFLAGLPVRVQRVEREAEAEIFRKALLATLQRVSSMLELDLAARGLRLLPGQQALWARLLSEILENPPPVAGDTLRDEALRYLTSAEAEIEIEDRRIVEDIAEKFGRWAETAPGKLEEELQGWLPQGLVDEDPQAVTDLASSLQYLYKSERQKTSLEQMLEGLSRLVGRDLTTAEPLRTELLGDLRELFDDVLFLPVSPDQPADVELKLFQTGMHRVSVSIDDQIVNSQLSSLGLAALVAMLLLMVQFRSFVAGLLGMVPMVLTLLVNFGVVAAFGVALDPATVMIASLVVGVGIDYTIHFLSRLKLELARDSDLKLATGKSLQTVGGAISINALTVACGMLVFLAGRLVPLRTFGCLLALAMVVSALAALLLLPAILLAARPKFLRGGGGGS